MAEKNFDVIIIGGGPGGYVTAIRGAQLGLKVCIIEEKYLGGICLNWGCIPTKALLRSAEVYHNMKNADEFGLTTEKVGFDLKRIIERSRGVSDQLSSGVAFLLKKNNITVIDGKGKLAGPGKVVVSNRGNKLHSIKAKHIIIATGARPRKLPGLEPDGKLIWTYFEALNPDIMPQKLLIIGSGAIGVEFASFYNTLGSKVTIVEVLPQILPVEDVEISNIASKQLESQGMTILTEAKIIKAEKNKNTVTAFIENKSGELSKIKVDRIISAVGVVGNIEDIGLETVKAKTAQGHIITDEFSATYQEGLYAIGDVAGSPRLAHKAEHEGTICIEKIAGLSPRSINKDQIPGCTFGRPQIASVGLTEKAAEEAGFKLKVGRFPYKANGKAITLGDSDGLVKTIFDAKTGQLLGAHIVGAESTEMIQGFVVAMGLETTEEELMQTIFPHPTLSEMMHESVLNAFGRSIHN
jgi:dihydrolipoamide dehydrogenase